MLVPEPLLSVLVPLVLEPEPWELVPLVLEPEQLPLALVPQGPVLEPAQVCPQPRLEPSQELEPPLPVLGPSQLHDFCANTT